MYGVTQTTVNSLRWTHLGPAQNICINGQVSLLQRVKEED